ncbi:MAG: hypothetical protein [Caudoviricetes sp.]|nr:MAG: hypothetical protein [Caudoviricetes sp.]
MAETRTGFGQKGAKEVYDELVTDRKPYETRAKDNAELTIPALFPDATSSGSTEYKTPWQSVGAKGVNNLASKLMMSLFPNETWLRLNISVEEAMALVGQPDKLAEVDSGLSSIERTVMNNFEVNSYRVPLFEGIKQLLIAGNFLLNMPEAVKGESYTPLKLYNLLKYVVQRDTIGNVMQIVCLDEMARGSLPEDIKKQLEDQSDNPDQLSDVVEVYTHVYWDAETNKYLKYEEVEGVEIEGTDAEYPKYSCPYIPVRMIRQTGEHYGRSYVEEYKGDLQSLETISEAIMQTTMISQKVVRLVNPTGVTNVRRLNKAKNGEYVSGRAEDIHDLQMNKQADFQIAFQMSQGLEKRLNEVFLLNSAVQRNAERVTAEEIRYVARELEAVLGGVYTVLTQELQMPMVQTAMRQLQATSKIPKLPNEVVEPMVTTGIDAMGRGQDLERLGAFIQAVTGAASLQQVESINTNTLIIRLANALGIDTAGLIRTDEEIQQKQQEAAQQQAMMAAAQTGGAGMGAQATSSPEAMQNAQEVAMAQG